ncbi:MAG: hypothetical protein M0008_14585 [Actinomycetota bacterium]|nr:hypothetical protein [Actinomycetota bacterium]
MVAPIFALDLWNPHVGIALWAVVATAFLLGMVHGVTPDEHTWPITFSYAVGGYSSRAGMRNALIFSLAFTLQRALASELAYFSLANFLTLGSRGDYIVYVIVGIAMLWAARYVHRGRLPWHVDLHLHLSRRAEPRGGTPEANDASGVGIPAAPGQEHPQEHDGHLIAASEGGGAHLHVHSHGGVSLAESPHWAKDPCENCKEPDLQDPRAWMPAVHGFIAGWGFGAFAIIVYTVLAPSMPSALWGWVPGALFGLGTTVVQVMVGGLVGWFVRRKGATPEASRRLGLVVATRTLWFGGAAFVVGGSFGVIFPGLAGLRVSTGLRVHNLAHLGLPLVLVVISVAGVGIGSLVSEVRKLPRSPIAPE